MYTDRNFKTKKELKTAVEAWNASLDVNANAAALLLGNGAAPASRPVTYHQPGPFGGNEPRDGEFSVEGPHYPQSHRWYARVVAKDGVIIKVK